MLVCYSLFCVFKFTSIYYWPPIIIPILTIILLTLHELFSRYYLTILENIRIDKKLKLYLSSAVTSQTMQDKELVLNNAICLVTDVANFTSISEKLTSENCMHLANTIIGDYMIVYTIMAVLYMPLMEIA